MAEEEPWRRASRIRPKLTATELVEHLKGKGVTFKLCSEDEAADYLENVSPYTHSACYRKLYPVKAQGPRAGDYIGLDFGALVTLSTADRVLRSSLREVCVDVEHFARQELQRRIDRHGGDGYQIVWDYLAHKREQGNARLESALRSRSATGKFPDEYSGGLISHYLDDIGRLSDWTLLEVTDFGQFVDFWLFCSERWGDKGMAETHYVLKSVKALRNACSHNSCIINGFCASAEIRSYPTPECMMASMNERGMRNGKSRRAKLRNLRISQIAATLYASSVFCTRPSTRDRHGEAMHKGREALSAALPLCPVDGSLASYFEFLFKLVDTWTPYRS